jgi:hypothetical protein
VRRTQKIGGCEEKLPLKEGFQLKQELNYEQESEKSL